MALNFLSFGSDSKYLELSNSTLNELSLIYPDAIFFNSDVNYLDLNIISYAKKFPRGFGYWRWKPYVVNKYLSALVDGDILFYIDGRCFVPPVKIHWLDTFLNNLEFDIVAWQTSHLEAKFTTGDLFNIFNLKNDGNHAMTGQFAGGIFALRVNLRTRNLIHKWDSFLSEYISFVRDEPSLLPNNQLFVSNRHDQSVFSLLLKTSTELKIFTLTDTDIYRPDSIRAHGKSHPS